MVLRSAKLWLPALVLLALVLWSGGQREPRLGKPLPAVSLEVAAGPGSAEGDRVRLDSLAGKVVVLDFWASFCAPCRASVPALNALQRNFGPRGLVVYGVNGESLAPGRVATVSDAWGLAYPTLADSMLTLAMAFRVEAFPTLLLFDRSGKLRHVHKGLPTASELESQISNIID